MASFNERRENGDGSYSINVAITDSDGILQMDVVPRYKRIVLGMQGQSLGAGATLTQAIDLSGYNKAVFGVVFSAALTGSMVIYNSIGNLWVSQSSATLTAVTSGQTSNTFTPIAEKQTVSITNTGASPITITTAEVIAS